jgi:hypothetical protein
MKIPIPDGFHSGDVTGSGVAVINGEMAKRFYPNSDPIGRARPSGPSDSIPWFTIVGVAKDVREIGPEGRHRGTSTQQGPQSAFRQRRSTLSFALAVRRGVAPSIQRQCGRWIPVFRLQLRSMDACSATREPAAIPVAAPRIFAPSR